ncbi:hypothetical protein FSP39_018801 [Pinctada imbricata]|uniref:UspA domain-containing protein n=1 Tax=Pinctada imbricata TaxID=66713 RepID=A0AA88YAE5_PINIB|nr:hypothetical protein FSP39_018801 [Pinctada imbricata]
MEKCYQDGDTVIIVYCAEFNGIYSNPVTLMSNDPKLIVNLIEGEEERVQKLAKKYEDMIKKYKTNGKIVRVNGKPGEGIIEVAKKENAALIVTGSRGLGTIRRTVLGSVSNYVLHHSHIPVLVFRN